MKYGENHDTPIIYASIPIGSTVAVQCKDRGPWIHGTVESKGNHNHSGRAYTIGMTKIGQMVTRNSKHVMPTQLTTEQYF